MKDASSLLHSPAAKHWKIIKTKPHHGLAIPLFSIHSARSTGIGEFSDLPLLIDFCFSIGLDVIQLLPLNDTGMGISPYSALSAFALNPLYIGISHLPHLNEYPLLKEELKALPKFPDSPRIHYDLVREQKESFLRQYIYLCGHQLQETAEYKKFIHDSQSWLRGYAVFKILKKQHSKGSWESWPENERVFNSALIDSIPREEKEEFDWHCLLQFLCDEQLKAAKRYASSKGIFLMGDIPILIDRDSADVWLHQDLFNLEYSAGAPPDMYCEEGQNWGFPLYNWKTMAMQNYDWWKSRLNWANHYYHIYRIDHIVGFFRIWAIPAGLSGKEGYFIPRDEKTWIDHGQRLMLMMLEGCEMLPIGEDLGVIPPEVRKCLSALGICGTRVLRWERKWNENKDYIPPEEYSIDSLSTVSTHDSETLQQWWKSTPAEAQLFSHFKGWTYQPILSREYHREILWDSHHTGSLFHINPLQEYLALLPGLTWMDPENERINVPGIFSDHNWRYRVRPSLEELLNNDTLKHTIKELIQ